MKAAKTAWSVLLVLVMLFSLFFVIAEADHDCASEDCAVCRIIGIIEEAFGKASLLLVAAAVALSVRVAALCARMPFGEAAPVSSLVLLKVKLSD